MKKLKTVGMWLLQILFAFLFILVGSGKFLQSEMWAGRFAGWGYPDGFSYLIGGLEVLGGLALLIPLVAGIGAAGLVVILVGAVGTHGLHGEPFWWPLVFGLLLSVVVYLRRPPFLRKAENSGASQAEHTEAS
jgi:uncharacterized membrane protein YphA (DoxX/SURF4 family)